MRSTRSSYTSHQQLALGAAVPPRKPRPTPMRSRSAQQAAGWALALLAVAYAVSVLVQ